VITIADPRAHDAAIQALTMGGIRTASPPGEVIPVDEPLKHRQIRRRGEADIRGGG
jgi:hypothetical protein